MSLTVKSENTKPNKCGTEVVLLPVHLGLKDLPSISAKIDEKIKKILKSRDCRGRWGETEIIPPSLIGTEKFYAIIGLGEETNTSKEGEAMRRGCAAVASETNKLGLKSLAVDLFHQKNITSLANAALEGVELVNYQFTCHSEKLTRQNKNNKTEKIIFLSEKENFKPINKEVKRTKDMLTGVALARDLINQPASHMSPRKLVATARDISAKSDLIKLKILDRKQAAKKNFNAFLSVAKGSGEEPYVIHLTYRPTAKKDNNPKKVWLVGKGITFDSGGLSLKPADGMQSMKIDMGGAATVLGVFSVLAQLKPDVEIHGVIAACENMPSGSSYRPGDVITAKNGKTIEVLNTDAEGRITMADALSYAAENNPDAIIDIATLTGASMIALGETVAGLWSSDNELADQIITAGTQSGENIETMPMPVEYSDKLKSQVADIANIADTRYGGAITAAMFLKEFTREKPWAHIDFAGPAYMSNKYLPYWDKGATGFGVRTLLNYITQL